MIMPLFIGTSELLLIAALVLLLFGGKKLPEMMRGMGQGVKAFKDGMNTGEGEETKEPKPETPADKINNAAEQPCEQPKANEGQQ